MSLKLPLWTAPLCVMILSYLFTFIRENGSPVYSVEYILGFNGVMWALCGLVYVGEFAYNKIKIKWEL